ncbi:hypothetical protein LJC45_04965 [Alistipes sp. OttesenSCG-928-B03]|nr:hypothetical protein [Alistipes sp. OttesenSCG-928-B03]
MLDNWQRIEQIIKWAGFASVSAFAREIGLNRSENLYQIKRGNNGISRDLAQSITERFPEISKGWLMSGEGAMLRGEAQVRDCDIPFFKHDAVQMVTGAEKPDPEYYISFPVFGGSDFAAFTFADAMEPVIARGTMLFFRKVAVEEAVPGGIYLVVAKTFSGIRYLRRDPGSVDVRLVAANKKEFDEVVVPADSIGELYHVCGIVINKSC